MRELPHSRAKEACVKVMSLRSNRKDILNSFIERCSNFKIYLCSPKWINCAGYAATCSLNSPCQRMPCTEMGNSYRKVPIPIHVYRDFAFITLYKSQLLDGTTNWRLIIPVFCKLIPLYKIDCLWSNPSSLILNWLMEVCWMSAANTGFRKVSNKEC